ILMTFTIRPIEYVSQRRVRVEQGKVRLALRGVSPPDHPGAEHLGTVRPRVEKNQINRVGAETMRGGKKIATTIDCHGAARRVYTQRDRLGLHVGARIASRCQPSHARREKTSDLLATDMQARVTLERFLADRIASPKLHPTGGETQ